MVFTERQKSELVSIVKEVTQKIISDKNFMDSLASKVADIVAQKIDEQVRTLETKINNLECQIKGYQTEREELYLKMDDFEQYTKLNQLRLYGLTENNNDLKTNVCDVIQSKLGISNVDIAHCFRIGKQAVNSTKPRPVVVEFTSAKQRNMVYLNKKKLKNSKLVIVEELTLQRYQLLMLAKDKIGRDKVWTMDGKIFARISGRKMVLRSEDDILKQKGQLDR